MAELERIKADAPVIGKARNVILFIGDGMGVATLTAARIHQGQRQGLDGESFVPAMDRLSNTALVKTYSHDGQVSDSAPTATAILTGVKTRNGVIGIGPEVPENECAVSKAHRLPSLFGFAQAQGMATGVISTARIMRRLPPPMPTPPSATGKPMPTCQPTPAPTFYRRRVATPNMPLPRESAPIAKT
ncbi:hypothetical protein ASE85_12840 [Sphingobium sp. Leaf26]|uniref:alkaline phosphatase n=1 Tax=Sphingobium sp. Leaf26 TaxID=1735693 RepID=UPI0006F8FB01|nr:alkaline phosphatase [Sphingobium sp. Leaf26]KQM97777.1 hypothetical protein ASE85_12840 [Sphingobium sp. Leaf26]